MKSGKIVVQSGFSLIFIFLFCQQIVLSGELAPGEKRRIESGAIDTFEIIVSLWKREKFDEMYEYGDRVSQDGMSKERFMSRMKYSCRLASSWETVRDIKVQIISPTHVYLKAKMGFASPSDEWGETTFGTKVFEMTLEKGEWRVELSNLLCFGSGGGIAYPRRPPPRH
jgi:hypothetical protein